MPSVLVAKLVSKPSGVVVRSLRSTPALFTWFAFDQQKRERGIECFSLLLSLTSSPRTKRNEKKERAYVSEKVGEEVGAECVGGKACLQSLGRGFAGSLRSTPALFTWFAFWWRREKADCWIFLAAVHVPHLA